MASPGGVEVARLSARVVPDTSRLASDLKAALDKLERELKLNIRASIDTTRLDADARAAVDQAQLAAGDLNIKAKVDTSQVREAEVVLSQASSAATGFSSGLGAVGTAALVLGPALIPLAAVLAGLVASLVAPLAIVGGGLTLFGVLAGFTVAATLKQIKTIDGLKAKLSTLDKGTSAYTDTLKQLRAAQQGLTPAAKAFQGAIAAVKSALSSIPPGVFLKPITDGLKLFAKVLPAFEPVIRAASRAIDDIVGDLNRAAGSAGFKSFVTAFAKQLGPDLKAFARIGKNVFKGLFGLFGAFNTQLSGTVLKSIETLTDRFANWGETVGQSKGFRAFVAYIKRIGPQVAKTLGDVAGALGDIVAAAAPLGSAVLTAVDAVARAIKAIPQPILEGIVAAIIAIAGLGVSPEIGVLVGGFIALARVSKPLQRIIGDLADFFKEKLLPAIKDAAQKVIPAFKDALKNINQTLRDNKGFIETFGKVILTITAAEVIGAILTFAKAVKGIGLAFKFGVGFAHLFADAVLVSLAFLIRGFGEFLKVVLGVFGTVIDAQAKAFGWLPKIGPKIRDAQANFHAFADGVSNNIDGAAQHLDNFRAQIDEVFRPPHVFKVTLDDLKAVKDLEALQAFRLHDKTLTIRVEQQIDRAVGPGGGIGLPTGPTPQKPPPLHSDSSGSGTGTRTTTGALVHADKIEVRDVNDLLRKTANLARSRSGGGVILAGAS